MLKILAVLLLAAGIGGSFVMLLKLQYRLGRLDQHRRMVDAYQEWSTTYLGYHGRDWLLLTSSWNAVANTAPFEHTNLLPVPTAEEVAEMERKQAVLFKEAIPE